MLNSNHLPAKGAVALLLLAAFTGPTELPATVPEAGTEITPADCELTLRPAELHRAPEPVVVRASLSGEIGAIQDIAVQDDSGIQVERVEAPSPAALVITLHTEGARAGEWTLTVTGEQGECTGSVEVVEGAGHSLR